LEYVDKKGIIRKIAQRKWTTEGNTFTAVKILFSYFLPNQTREGKKKFRKQPQRGKNKKNYKKKIKERTKRK